MQAKPEIGVKKPKTAEESNSLSREVDVLKQIPREESAACQEMSWWDFWSEKKRFTFCQLHRYTSDYRIWLSADELYGHRELLIMDSPNTKSIPLGNVIEYLVLRALAHHAKNRQTAGQFMRLPDLVDELCSLEGVMTQKGNLVADVVDEFVVRKAIKRIRDAVIKKLGSSSDVLIETAPEKGAGYRLSVCPGRIIIDDPPALCPAREEQRERAMTNVVLPRRMGSLNDTEK
jgi:hypothetical protein